MTERIKKEIESISFGVYSASEIEKFSVCSLDSIKKSGYGSVYDPRMGSTESEIICETCKENANVCHGHFGHIKLYEPILHPMYYRKILSFLQCFCKKCYRLLLTEEYIKLKEWDWNDKINRFKNIIEVCKKIETCSRPECMSENPKIKFTPVDETFTMILSDVAVSLSPIEIMKIFNNIIDDDVRLIGLDPELIHPRNLIITLLPVLPPIDRPYVKADGNICDDDLTNQYIDIIKANNSLHKLMSTDNKCGNVEMKKQKYLNTIRFRISTTFNNSHGKAKHTANGRSIKGIKERLTGKSGIVRSGVLAKRCNHTARTVIGPEPTLGLNQLAVPEFIAGKLVYPERVSVLNIERLQKMVNSGLVKVVEKPNGVRINIKRYRNGTYVFCGDKVLHSDGTETTVTQSKGFIINKGDRIVRDGKFIDKTTPSNRPYPIEIGWIVERPLQNGDWVLFNRQPRQKIKTNSEAATGSCPSEEGVNSGTP